MEGSLIFFKHTGESWRGDKICFIVKKKKKKNHFEEWRICRIARLDLLRGDFVRPLFQTLTLNLQQWLL